MLALNGPPAAKLLTAGSLADMGFLNRTKTGAQRRDRGAWMPKAPSQGLSAEEERLLEADDLSELLAATNAKRAARGKPALSEDEIELGLWSERQEMRRRPEA